MLWMLVIGAVFAVSLRWRMAPIAALAMFLAGIELRLAHFGSSLSSDVLSVTRAAAETMLSGDNPYGIGYDVSVPPGAPYPYGPLGLLWYVPTLDEPRVMEILAAVVVLGLLASAGLDDWLGRSESRARWPFESWNAPKLRRLGAESRTASPRPPS